jgi:hypothetical protein
MASCITPPQNCCVLQGEKREDGWTDSGMSQLLPDCVKRLALIMAGVAGFAQLKQSMCWKWVSYMGKILNERQNLLLETFAVSTADRCL